jgi:hypothetical protein
MNIISVMLMAKLMGAYHVPIVDPPTILGRPDNVCTTKPGDTTRDENTGKPPNRGDGRGKDLPRRK